MIHSNHNNNNNNISTSSGKATTEVVRPTEAQLRWAQFHHQRRASAVRDQVQRLWQTPASVSDVDGALSDDGNTTVSSNDSNAENSPNQAQQRVVGGIAERHRRRCRREQKKSLQKQTPKPSISRGRRALLRVSKRAYEKRRQQILAHGFLCAAGDDDETELQEGPRQHGHKKQQLPQPKFLKQQDSAEDDGVENIFAEETAWKKKRKRRHARRFVVSDDEERVRRFEAAFHAMMMNMSASRQHPEPVISPSGKRWTRAVPVAISIDGRHYDDLKWGVTFRTNSAESPNSGTGSNSMTPLDRGASWMIHLPSKPKTQPKHPRIAIPEHEDDHSPNALATPSAGRLKFNSLVALLQQRTMFKSGRDLMERRVPKMRLRLGKENLDSEVIVQSVPPDKRWKKPETRENPGRVGSDSRAASNNHHHREQSEEHPNHVEFMADGRQLVLSLQDSDSSGLHSPFRHSGHDSGSHHHREIVIENDQGKRWTFNGHSIGTPESDAFTDLFATLRDGDTPKSLGESVADSDIYSALRNADDEATPKSMDPNHGFRSSASHRLSVTTTSDHAVLQNGKDARYQRLLLAQDTNDRGYAGILTGSRLSQHNDTSPGKRSVGSMSSSEVSPSNVKGIWRSARSAAGAALSHLSVTMINTAMEHASGQSQTGRMSVEKKFSTSQASTLCPDQSQVENFPSYESHRFRHDEASMKQMGAVTSNGALDQESARSSESEESRFWADARNGGRQFNSDDDKDRNDSLRHGYSSSSDSESSVWRAARNMGDVKSPSSLPSIPESLMQDGTVGDVPLPYHSYEDSVSPGKYRKDDADTRTDESDNNSNSSKGSDVWRMLRNQAKVGSRFLNIIPEAITSNNEESTSDKSPDIKSSISNTAARAVGSLGGVLKMLSGKKEEAHTNAEENPNVEDDVELDDDEIKAVAAFRKTQNERRHFDAKSASTSSFGEVPESIRRAVQQFGVSNLEIEDNDDVISEENPAQSFYDFEDNDGQEYISTVNSSTSRSMDKLSPERVRDMHQMVMMNSVLIGDKETEHTIIDTDDTTSSASIDGYNPRAIASLLLSPALLTKRLHQAIRAIEKRNWDQVGYLLSANPWLAEMVDVTTNQYLLHKLALYGGGACEVNPVTGQVVNVQHPPAPEQLNNDLIRMFPASVHKFDKDGNLPLHMAAASGNINMIKLLASRFPEGASVRNEEGMLPLHLIILACASPSVAINAKESPKEMVEALLGYFRGAIAIADNDGNLPLHSAAISLVGDIGVDVVYLLLDEADRQAADPYGPRFSSSGSKVRGDDDSVSVATEDTASPTDSSHTGDDVVRCNVVRNLLGETALMAAINARAGWEMIEAIACGAGGREAVLLHDSNGNTALHLLVSGETADPAAVVSILKISPQAATQRNDDGMLPIEVACMQSMPREVIVALLLVDLPIDLDNKEGIKLLEGYGGSWWFLTCECDDHYVDVVEEVVSICSYQQMREMCFMKGGPMKDGGPVVSRATPKCREVLLRALRFVGRFEFLGNASINLDSKPGVKIFDALDFGTDDEPFDDGRRVLLYCFATEDCYLEVTAIRRGANLDVSLVEETFDFLVHEDGTDASPPQQFCVAVESPVQTLNLVVAGMLDNPDYERKPELRKRYMIKVCSVLRQVAKGLRHLHSNGVIHADLCLENCGKFGDTWKLASTMGIQTVGKPCDPSRFGESAPPEAVELVKLESNPGASRQASFKKNLVAHPSMDVWAFGKLAFEAIVGEPLLDFDTTLHPKDDSTALHEIMKWSKANLKEVAQDLAAVGVPKGGIELITQCLSPQPHKRPATMDRILAHPFWKEMQRLNSSSERSGRGNRSHQRMS